MKRYKITDAAQAEVAETFGHLFAGYILAEVPRRKGERWFAPVGIDGPIETEAHPLFDDQVEEV